MFVWKIRVYYEDTDAGGIVYYANYLRFLERARTEWLRSLGCEQDSLWQNDNLIFVVKSIHVDYLKPAYFNDSLEVHTQMADTGRAHLDMQQKITRGPDTLTTAAVTVVCMHRHSFKPVALPTGLLKDLGNAV